MKCDDARLPGWPDREAQAEQITPIVAQFPAPR